MIRCPYCGYENEEGAKFCMDCGKPIASAARTRQEDAALVANTGLLLGQAARRARLEAVYEAGLEWCIAQSRDLIAHGVPAIHYYTMGRTVNIRQILSKVF